MEQELSRPYVYVCHRFAPTGFWIISIKEPGQTEVIYDWKIEQAELGRARVPRPMYVKSKGRYYFSQTSSSSRRAQRGPGAVVFDVTGLRHHEDQGRSRGSRPRHPGGFHENYTYKHSSGAALLFTP